MGSIFKPKMPPLPPVQPLPEPPKAELSAEEKEEIKEKTPRTFALRAGLDMIKLGRTQFEDGYQGLEIVGDVKLNKRLAVAAEIGSEQRTKQTEQVNFTTTGSYIKLGVDYNFFNNWKVK